MFHDRHGTAKAFHNRPTRSHANTKIEQYLPNIEEVMLNIE